MFEYATVWPAHAGLFDSPARSLFSKSEMSGRAWPHCSLRIWSQFTKFDGQKIWGSSESLRKTPFLCSSLPPEARGGGLVSWDGGCCRRPT